MRTWTRRELLRFSGALGMGAVLPTVAGCTPDSPNGPAPGPTPTVRPGMPTADEMIGWIRAIANQGVRRPGYPADAWVEAWLEAQFPWDRAGERAAGAGDREALAATERVAAGDTVHRRGAGAAVLPGAVRRAGTAGHRA